MSARPRPVTATVTKPRWMQIPDPDTRAKLRNRSLDSHGSEESLTSILDRVNNYASDNDTVEDERKESVSEESLSKTFTTDTDNYDNKKQNAKDGNSNSEISRDSSPTKSVSTRTIENRLSAWEQWIVHKAKENQIKKREEKHKKQEEEALKQRYEQEKQIKLKKAESIRQQWTEQKNKEVIRRRKQEKTKKHNEKIQKEEIENQIKQKAEEKYSLWAQMKNKEEKDRRRKIKEENQKIQQHEQMRRSMAEAKFNEWLKQAAGRPRSAPNSFGYLSGKMTDVAVSTTQRYHDRSAYPTPTFVNPQPWTPVAVIPQKKLEVKTKKSKNKPYKWNPEKYF